MYAALCGAMLWLWNYACNIVSGVFTTLSIDKLAKYISPDQTAADSNHQHALQLQQQTLLLQQQTLLLQQQALQIQQQMQQNQQQSQQSQAAAANIPRRTPKRNQRTVPPVRVKKAH